MTKPKVAVVSGTIPQSTKCSDEQPMPQVIVRRGFDPIADVWNVMRTNRARHASQKECESPSHRNLFHVPPPRDPFAALR